MAIRNTEVRGDFTTGRNMRVGGGLEVSGSGTVRHNLKVEGWLDARNVRLPDKGLFLTEAALKAAYPEPRPGWYAMVIGAQGSASFGLYVGTAEGRWVRAEGEYPIANLLDVDYYDQWITEVQEKQTELEEELEAIEMKLDAPMYGVMTTERDYRQEVGAWLMNRTGLMRQAGESAKGLYVLESAEEKIGRWCMMVPKSVGLRAEEVRLNSGAPFPFDWRERVEMPVVVEGMQKEYVMMWSEELKVKRVEVWVM